MSEEKTISIRKTKDNSFYEDSSKNKTKQFSQLSHSLTNKITKKVKKDKQKNCSMKMMRGEKMKRD